MNAASRSGRPRASAALLLLPVLLTACAEDPLPVRPPNIVLITVESLRTDHLSLYGYQRETTPNLDRLAEQAIVFDNAFSVTSWTLASHASLFTGLYPAAHDTLRPRDRLKDSYVTLAEALAESGYQTAGIVSGEYLREQFNLQQGFERYDDAPAAARKGAIPTNPDMERSIRRFLTEERDPQRPFFLFLYFWDPHYAYAPPEPNDTLFVPEAARKPRQRVRFQKGFELGRHISQEELAFVEAQYDGEIRTTDAALQGLFRQLQESGLWEDSVVIVTADHGEQFFDHGHLGHKHSLYDEELHVPLLLKLPGRQAGRRDDRLVSLVDLYPTVLELAGLGGSRLSHGVSLLAEPRAEGEPIYHELKEMWYQREGDGRQSERALDWAALRMGDKKLIWRDQEAVVELFDLARDPGERTPLGAESALPIERWKQRLKEWREAMRKVAEQGGPPEKASLDATDEERLRELGYLR